MQPVNLQIVCLSGEQVAIPATLIRSYIREAKSKTNTAYPIAKLDNDARVWKGTWWDKESWIEHLLTGFLRRRGVCHRVARIKRRSFQSWLSVHARDAVS